MILSKIKLYVTAALGVIAALLLFDRERAKRRVRDLERKLEDRRRFAERMERAAEARREYDELVRKHLHRARNGGPRDGFESDR